MTGAAVPRRRHTNQMTLTDGARDFLADALDKSVPDEQARWRCFRLARSLNGRFHLAIGSPDADDIAFVHHDRTILVLDPRLGEHLAQRRIDIQTGPVKKQRLVIT